MDALGSAQVNMLAPESLDSGLGEGPGVASVGGWPEPGDGPGGGAGGGSVGVRFRAFWPSAEAAAGEFATREGHVILCGCLSTALHFVAALRSHCNASDTLQVIGWW